MPIKLDLSPFKGMFYYAQFNFCFKCLHNIAPDLFKSYFIKSWHVYSTRCNGLDIFIPKVHTESAKKGTFYTGAQAFNNLPPHLKEVDYGHL